jgi:hypothetical protein
MSADLSTERAHLDEAAYADDVVAAQEQGSTDRPAPWLVLAGMVALLVPLRAAVGPMRDIDAYWHLLVGREILAGAPVTSAGHGWSFAPVADTWVSTQWLAEVALARLEGWGGLQALIVVRVVAIVASLAVLAGVTLVRRPPRAGVLMFAIGALMLSITVQERSQQLTFLLAPLVGWWMERLWRDGRPPRCWVVLPLVVVWANVHGGWVILPIGLGVAAAARMVDRGWRDRSAHAALALAAGTLVAATVSPSGIDNVLAFRRFSSSTAQILEWRPVTFWDATAVPLAALLVVVLVAWGRGHARPTRGEMVIVVATLVFATFAWRNLAPAVLMLCPLLVGTLARALGDPDPSTERPPLARTAFGVGAVGAVLALVVAFGQNPVVDPSVPSGLIADVARATSGQRVLDSYNVSGPLLWFGGGPEHVSVAIDGRADRYGGAYIARYTDLVAAREGWQSTLDDLAPTAALLRRDEALSGVLVAERGWIVVGHEGEYVLLHAPGAPGWTQG